jgi:hypothetical protein
MKCVDLAEFSAVLPVDSEIRDWRSFRDSQAVSFVHSRFVILVRFVLVVQRSVWVDVLFSVVVI